MLARLGFSTFSGARKVEKANLAEAEAEAEEKTREGRARRASP